LSSGRRPGGLHDPVHWRARLR